MDPYHENPTKKTHSLSDFAASLVYHSFNKTMELRSAEKELEEIFEICSSLSPRLIDPETAPSHNSEGVVADNSDTTFTDSPQLLLETLESLQQRLGALESAMTRLDRRSKETDPVTGNPRYGTQTLARVQAVLQRYQESVTMLLAMEENLPELRRKVELERSKIRQQAERERRQAERENEAKRQEEERRLAEEQRVQDEARQREEEERAKRYRQAQQVIQAQDRARQEAEQADRDWVSSILKGPQGVQQQLNALVEDTANDPVAQSKALDALYTIFSQIVARPEEASFRRIRRDHAQFQQDIGRHQGGKELLIAAGFELGAIDDVPSFVSKEPNIEKDMDGWATWFDLLKATLDIIEKQMLK
jgi:DNA repair exonuclease SbcCD ATPase subunit